MKIEIKFSNNLNETNLPLIKLTKSLNGKTGTATFLFIYPEIFKSFQNKIEMIEEMTLMSNNKKIISKDISILFKDGKPFLIKTIFIFKNSQDWFSFLNFMNLYSKENGLLFASEVKLVFE